MPCHWTQLATKIWSANRNSLRNTPSTKCVTWDNKEEATSRVGKRTEGDKRKWIEEQIRQTGSSSCSRCWGNWKGTDQQISSCEADKRGESTLTSSSSVDKGKSHTMGCKRVLAELWRQPLSFGLPLRQHPLTSHLLWLPPIDWCSTTLSKGWCQGTANRHSIAWCSRCRRPPQTRLPPLRVLSRLDSLHLCQRFPLLLPWFPPLCCRPSSLLHHHFTQTAQLARRRNQEIFFSFGSTSLKLQGGFVVTICCVSFALYGQCLYVFLFFFSFALIITVSSPLLLYPFLSFFLPPFSFILLLIWRFSLLSSIVKLFLSKRVFHFLLLFLQRLDRVTFILIFFPFLSLSSTCILFFLRLLQLIQSSLLLLPLLLLPLLSQAPILLSLSCVLQLISLKRKQMARLLKSFLQHASNCALSWDSLLKTQLLQIFLTIDKWLIDSRKALLFPRC